MTERTGTDVFTAEQRSAVMRKVPGKNSSAELKLRRLLRRMGIGYRLHRKDLPGSPDVAMAGRKAAVFVHGCFWHAHGCRIGQPPKTRPEFWGPKLSRNRERDARTSAALAADGWRVITVWECEMKTPGFAERLVARVRDQAATVSASSNTWA